MKFWIIKYEGNILEYDDYFDFCKKLQDLLENGIVPEVFMSQQFQEF
jgi:hypothetical protein